MLLNREKFEALLIGCHDDTWPDLEPLLGNDLKRRLAGRFVVDPVGATAEEVREHAKRILEERHRAQLQGLLRETLGEAQRKGRGALGFRRVLLALERQEVQTLIVSNDFKAEASEWQTRELPDVTDALVDLALRSGADIEFCDPGAGLDKAGHVAALLRFRAEQRASDRIAL
jgi:peptide subunit release factor 1 (eRF1)